MLLLFGIVSIVLIKRMEFLSVGAKQCSHRSPSRVQFRRFDERRLVESQRIASPGLAWF